MRAGGLLRKTLKVIAHVLAIGLLYLAFSGALFLGLQVNPTYGTAALIACIVLLILYIRFGFKRR